MKKYNIDATDENVLRTIMSDQLSRSRDVKDFLEMLDTIEYNAFISLDAAWGEGKTFFIRQVEMTMRYYNEKMFDKEITEQEMNAFSKNGHLNNLDLKHTYYPIYFDSWLYDNHPNALMALLMVAIKQCNKYINTMLDTGIMKKAASILDSVQFWKSSNWSNLLESCKSKSILEETLLLEEVRQKVKEIFNDILVEEADKLIFFIDELDRCRPTFAIEMLECIKHYFDDDRIIFVMSVNKSQLVHTIAKYYGNNFNSSLYLNKFFDISIQLPRADITKYLDRLNISCTSSYWIEKFANELQKLYSLSLRDTTNYFQKVSLINEKCQGYESDSWRLMVFFIPLLCLFDIIDVIKKNEILSGNGIDIIEKIVESNESMKKYVARLVNKYENDKENYKSGIDELKEFYKTAFSDENRYGYYEGYLDVPANFKMECLRICNSV